MELDFWIAFTIMAKKKLFFFGRGLDEYSDVLIWIDNIIIFHINKTQGQFLHYIFQDLYQ